MKGKREDNLIRAKIRELHRNGVKIAKIAADFNLHRATVYRIIQERAMNPKKWGRPTMLSALDHCYLIHEFQKNKYTTAMKLAKSVKFPVSDRTIRRELQRNDFHHKKLTL